MAIDLNNCGGKQTTKFIDLQVTYVAMNILILSIDVYPDVYYNI